MYVVETQGVGLKRGAKNILKDINWQVEAGDRWILYGLNGSGKTTLLSVLSGYQSGTAGSLKLFGQDINEENIIALRRRIGWVSTSFYDQYLHYESIMDIVLAGKQGTLGISDDTISDADVRKAKSLLTQLGLRRMMRYAYDMLSRGQKQKVLLARAMMNDCELLLLDEPCSGLDILSRARVLYNLERYVQNTEKTLIYVAHHTDEILPFFNKAILLQQGSIHSQGRVADVFTEENLLQFFQIPATVVRTGEALQIRLRAEDIDLSRY